MKKHLLIIFLLLCMVLGGCASSGTVSDNTEDNLIDLSENIETKSGPFDRNTLGLIDENTKGDVSRGNKETVPDSADGLSFDDFDFFYDIMNDDIPEEAYYPAVKYAEGLWKYDLIYATDSYESYYFEEIGYSEFAIDYDKEQIVITLHPRLASDGYEAWTETDEEVGYEPFAGGFDEDNNLLLYGNNAVLDCLAYYAWSGREYFYGELWVSEEDYFVFLMTRGQE